MSDRRKIDWAAGAAWLFFMAALFAHARSASYSDLLTNAGLVWLAFSMMFPRGER